VFIAIVQYCKGRYTNYLIVIVIVITGGVALWWQHCLFNFC